MPDRIEIVAPRKEWANEFVELAGVLRETLGPIALRIDHIGSTSVPGLPAKDIIDIQVTVANLDVEPLSTMLASIGYIRRTDIAQDHVPRVTWETRAAGKSSTSEHRLINVQPISTCGKRGIQTSATRSCFATICEPTPVPRRPMP